MTVIVNKILVFITHEFLNLIDIEEIFFEEDEDMNMDILKHILG